MGMVEWCVLEDEKRKQRLKKTYLGNAQLGEYQIVVLAI